MSIRRQNISQQLEYFWTSFIPVMNFKMTLNWTDANVNICLSVCLCARSNSQALLAVCGLLYGVATQIHQPTRTTILAGQNAQHRTTMEPSQLTVTHHTHSHGATTDRRYINSCEAAFMVSPNLAPLSLNCSWCCQCLCATWFTCTL